MKLSGEATDAQRADNEHFNTRCTELICVDIINKDLL